MTPKLLLYCTKKLIKNKYHLLRTKNGKYEYDKVILDSDTILNGKIVAECDFEVEEIYSCPNYYDNEMFYLTNNCSYFNLLNESCLNETQLEDYLKGKDGYAIHLKNLIIYDTPRELSDYYHSESPFLPITKAPQNMMYCNGVIKTNFKLGDKVFKNVAYQIENYVLASVKPQWLCKILNGQKTIEIRKKVLKEML